MTKFVLPKIPTSEITPESIYRDRRRIVLAGMALLPGVLASCQKSGAESTDSLPLEPKASAAAAASLEFTPNSALSTSEPQTSEYNATHYNNFYEFGTGKADPARNSGNFEALPWVVSLRGEVEKPQMVDLQSLLQAHALEERIYRMRCVEGWSMVIPWIGFPLAELIKRMKPTSKAKYVAFKTLEDPKRMPGQRSGVLDWPYQEGLRLDEAMNPLTILATGMYGKPMPNQNGAPLRLVVPWKYGYKSIKSIVSIELTENQPETSWNQSAPDEYGFYSNVNPSRSHPRWSQKSERRISGGNSLFSDRIATLPFNGYADQVAAMYAGMDLIKNH